jgi:hypothetical protein
MSDNAAMPAGTATPVPFWQLPQAELERQIGSGPKGLSAEEAAARLLRHGPNAFGGRRRYGLALKMASRFRNPLVLILIGAALISALTGELASFVIISVIVLLSVVLDSLQEYRAEEAADRLRASVALMERVLRDGREITIKAEALVPGDLVLLAAGDLIPADGRLVETKDFFVNEALLTGEAFPVEKHAIADGVKDSEINGALNAAFMGSSVVSGTAAFLVVATGEATQLGAISTGLRHTPPPAALEQGIHEFGMLIVRITVLLVLFVLLVNLLFHRPLLESFLFALALAVGLTPELLPMIVSVTLARGALRMAKERVLVKRLAAIHDLGSMDVLCTDKTGTLTEAKIRLVRQIRDLRRGQPPCDGARLAEQPFRNRDPKPSGCGHHRAWRYDGAGWIARRGPLRFRASARLGAAGGRRAGASWWSKAPPRTSCVSPATTRRRGMRRPGLSTRRPMRGRKLSSGLWGRRDFARWAWPGAKWDRITHMPWWGMSRIWSSPASWPSWIRPSRASGRPSTPSGGVA